MFLKLLYFIWGYKAVERNKEELRIETDLSYSETYIRGAIFLFLFGSSLLSLFFGAYGIFLFYYGLSTFLILILLFFVIPAVILPEKFLSNILGYSVQNTIDTSTPGRYKTLTIITKKSRGLFQTNIQVSGTDSKARSFSYQVGPKGNIDSQKLPQDNSVYKTAGQFFRLYNFLVGVRPFFVLLAVIGTSIFSFFPIINIFLVLMFAYIGIYLFAVQWRSSKVLNKIILLAILLCAIVDFVIAASIDFAVFFKF